MGAIAARLVLLLTVGTTAALGQSITDTANANLVAAVTMGTLTPASNSTLNSGQMLFRLRNNSANGYRLDATATFAPGAAATVDGGTTIAATDIGIGIFVDTTAANVKTPRTDTILAGFTYDPAGALVAVIDGLTPYTNAAGGMATLADLVTTKRILSGTRISAFSGLGNPANYLTVTMKFGVLPQYFSPSTFSGVITLTISDAP